MTRVQIQFERILVLILIPTLVLLTLYGSVALSLSAWTTSPDFHGREIQKVISDYPTMFTQSERQLANQTSIPASVASKAVAIVLSHDYDLAWRGLIVIFVIGFIPMLLGAVVSRKSGELPREAPATDPHDDTVLSIPKTKMSSQASFSQAVVTADGIILSIIGGFLTLGGYANFLVLFGFSILLLGLILGFMTISYYSESIVKEKEFVFVLKKSSLSRFFLTSHYLFWYFALGLSSLVVGVI